MGARETLVLTSVNTKPILVSRFLRSFRRCSSGNWLSRLVSAIILWESQIWCEARGEYDKH